LTTTPTTTPTIVIMTLVPVLTCSDVTCDDVNGNLMAI